MCHHNIIIKLIINLPKFWEYLNKLLHIIYVRDIYKASGT